MEGEVSSSSTSYSGREQLFEIPVRAGEGPHLPDPGASGSSAVSRDESGHRDFRTFSHDDRSARSAGSSSATVHRHSSSWTPAAYVAEELTYQDLWRGFALLAH